MSTIIEAAAAKPTFDAAGFLRALPGFALDEPPTGREGAATAILEAHTAFRTREEYLAWRAGWRAAYRDLSAAIRGWKARRKERHPQHGPDAAWEAIGLAARARQMLVLRGASKEKARLQREAGARAAA